MASFERNGNRKVRGQLFKRRIPELGYYFIVTDTKETEQNYMFGLRNSIPPELQGKLVIKVVRASANKTTNIASTDHPAAETDKNIDSINRPNLHIDLQIHISPDSTPDQIDTIFASMAKHLYGMNNK